MCPRTVEVETLIFSAVATPLILVLRFWHHCRCRQTFFESDESLSGRVLDVKPQRILDELDNKEVEKKRFKDALSHDWRIIDDLKGHKIDFLLYVMELNFKTGEPEHEPLEQDDSLNLIHQCFFGWNFTASIISDKVPKSHVDAKSFCLLYASSGALCSPCNEMDFDLG